MALLILALLQRIFLMSSLMLLLVWLIFFMVLIKLLPILGTISGDRKSGSAGMPRPISYAVFCLKKKKKDNREKKPENRVILQIATSCQSIATPIAAHHIASGGRTPCEHERCSPPAS